MLEIYPELEPNEEGAVYLTLESDTGILLSIKITKVKDDKELIRRFKEKKAKKQAHGEGQSHEYFEELRRKDKLERKDNKAKWQGFDERNKQMANFYNAFQQHT